MKLKLAKGHVSLRANVIEMQALVTDGSFFETLTLAGGELNIVVSLVADGVAKLQFDSSTASFRFVFPRHAIIAELARPSRGGVGGDFDRGVFSLAIDMHDVRERAARP
ncbi:MAG: hypothetical protein JKX99_04990 [Robiginitomaculum sp.]|nr:hypothetical protein [Robiginitomaculum sp.]